MCFSLLWVAHLLILLVGICGCVAIIQILVPWITSKLGADGAVLAPIIEIIVWMAMAVIVIWLVYDLLSCAVGSIRVW